MKNIIVRKDAWLKVMPNAKLVKSSRRLASALKRNNIINAYAFLCHAQR